MFITILYLDLFEMVADHFSFFLKKYQNRSLTSPAGINSDPVNNYKT